MEREKEKERENRSARNEYLSCGDERELYRVCQKHLARARALIESSWKREKHIYICVYMGLRVRMCVCMCV